MWKMRIAQFLRPYVVVTALCALYAVAVVSARGDALALVTIGARYSPQDAAHSYSEEGYDGQFIYYIARDPADAAALIDVPSYRYQRILLPLLGRALALGSEALLPWALLAVNLVALGVGTWLLEGMLTAEKVSRWYALGYGLSMGAFGAARLILPEPLAYALVLGAIWQLRRGRVMIGAVLFAAAALAKETTLIFAAVYGLQLLYRKGYRTGFSYGVVVLLPFVAWQWALFQRFGQWGVGSGGALATSFELVPFMGIIRILTEGGAAVFAILMMILAPFVVLPTLWGLWRGYRDYRVRRWSVESGALFSHALVMLFVPFSTYREPLGILRFIIGLQVALLLYAAHRRKRRVLRYATLWALALLFLVTSDFSG